MCVRYTFEKAEALRRLLELMTGDTVEIGPRYNVAPGQKNLVVAQGAGEDRPRVHEMKWGLVPYWDRSEKPKIAPLNARSEEMMGKPTFRQPVQKRRCAVPADGFYEWRRPDEKTKIPHLISLKDRAPFFFAGLYEDATAIRPETYALLTCRANDLVAPINDRMPVILTPDTLPRWLCPGPITPEEVASICVPYDAGAMQAWVVSPLMNNSRNDMPECVVPVLN